MDEADFARVVEEGRALQQVLPHLGLVAVGGTAVALHCGHRYSLDVDEVTPLLQSHYEDVTARLEAWEGWSTNRRNPPVLILGERHGVELGVRQQRRTIALKTIAMSGLTVPSAHELLRVKAFLLAERRATRDYIDVAALVDKLAEQGAIQSLSYLNLAYPTMGPQSAVSRFAEACQSDPADLAVVDLATYKGLRAPYTEAAYVLARCRALGRALIKLEVADNLPRTLDDCFQ